MPVHLVRKGPVSQSVHCLFWRSEASRKMHDCILSLTLEHWPDSIGSASPARAASRVGRRVRWLPTVPYRPPGQRVFRLPWRGFLAPCASNGPRSGCALGAACFHDAAEALQSALSVCRSASDRPCPHRHGAGRPPPPPSGLGPFADDPAFKDFFDQFFGRGRGAVRSFTSRDSARRHHRQAGLTS